MAPAQPSPPEADPREPHLEEVVAIIVAAGSSSRMGADKIWAPLAGRPVLAHSIQAFAATPGVTRIVVVTPADRHAEVRALHPSDALDSAVALDCVEGGARRQDSVAAGMEVAPDAGWYLVHDGARPLITPALVQRVLDAARASGAAVPGVPVVDTIKRITEAQPGEDLLETGERVQGTVDRILLRAVQTPQAFRADLLRRAHEGVAFDATDDASMVEALGEPVTLVQGDRANIKITTPPDLVIAEALLASRAAGGDEAVPAQGREQVR